MHAANVCRIIAVMISLAIVATCWADGPMNLLNRDAIETEKGLVPTSPQVVTTFVDNGERGLSVTINPGPDTYPGITLNPPTGIWNLSAYGYVDACITNTSKETLNILMRVDNDGEWAASPWSVEQLCIQSQSTGLLRVYFGCSWGKDGFALKPEAVVRILLFTGTSSTTQSFRILSLNAGGAPGSRPPVDPRSIRIIPSEGWMLGSNVVINIDKQIFSVGAYVSAQTNSHGGTAIQLDFSPSQTGASVKIQPEEGRWDLRFDLEVCLGVKNKGVLPVTPRVRLESDGGPSDWVELASPLAPGASTEIVVPFAAAVPWAVAPLGTNTATYVGAISGTGTTLISDTISGVVLAVDGSTEGHSLLVESIRARVPPSPVLPKWIGQRPPVPGDWIITFDESFNGTVIDTNRWSVSGDNWWDKITHFSKDNVIVGDGVVKLRYEKKRGFHNDDPHYFQWPPAVTGATDYAAGFLTTYDRWTQCYGYFESRLKLPKTSGIWPAFWMMPDRGRTYPAEKRGDTADGGLEFDIMESLSRWGTYRYNVAMHWDGYGKEHGNCGSGTIYVQPDKDGFLTCGLLWLPGVARFYCNGREVLHWENPRIASVPAYILFTTPSGGWDNDALDDTKLPADFVIDYVRVWQRKDLIQQP